MSVEPELSSLEAEIKYLQEQLSLHREVVAVLLGIQEALSFPRAVARMYTRLPTVEGSRDQIHVIKNELYLRGVATDNVFGIDKEPVIIEVVVPRENIGALIPEAHQPPQLLEHLLCRCAGRNIDDLLGDLEDLYNVVYARAGEHNAQRWYRTQVLRSCRSFIIERFTRWSRARVAR